jgi:hypothetical protein
MDTSMFKKTLFSLALVTCSFAASATSYTYDFTTNLNIGSAHGSKDHASGFLTGPGTPAPATFEVIANQNLGQVHFDIVGGPAGTIVEGLDAFSQSILENPNNFVEGANNHQWSINIPELLKGQVFKFEILPGTIHNPWNNPTYTPATLGSTPHWTYNINATANPVPVPAAIWLLGTGLVGLISYGRRQVTAA